MMSIGDLSASFRTRLALQREQRCLTQAELGAKAGIAPGAVSHFETGQRLPSLESIVRLADALECSVDFLLGRQPQDVATVIDPVFVRASRADAQTLDAVRRVTAALLNEPGHRSSVTRQPRTRRNGE
jgi:transcriptional regulator with XRE-family HTH domain